LHGVSGHFWAGSQRESRIAMSGWFRRGDGRFLSDFRGTLGALPRPFTQGLGAAPPSASTGKSLSLERESWGLPGRVGLQNAVKQEKKQEVNTMRRWLMLGVMAGIIAGLCGCGGGATAQVGKKKHVFGKLAVGLEHLADSLSSLPGYSTLPQSAKDALQGFRKLAEPLQGIEKVVVNLPASLLDSALSKTGKSVDELDTKLCVGYMNEFRTEWLSANIQTPNDEARQERKNRKMVKGANQWTRDFNKLLSSLQAAQVKQDKAAIIKHVGHAYEGLLLRLALNGSRQAKGNVAPVN